MISELTRLKISIICYAEVSGRFAMFCNPKLRGSNFSWEWFVEYCREESSLWISLHGIRLTKNNREEITSLAQQYSAEIARRLVHYASAS